MYNIFLYLRDVYLFIQYNRRVVFVRVPFKFPEGLEKDRLHLTDNAKMQIMSALSEAAADIRGYFSGKPGSMRGVQHVLAGCEVEAKAAKRTSDTAKESACAVPVPSKRQVCLFICIFELFFLLFVSDFLTGCRWRRLFWWRGGNGRQQSDGKVARSSSS